MRVQVIQRTMPYTIDPRVNTNIDYYLAQDPLATAPQIVDFIKSHAGPRVLDFGCGIGGYAYHFQELGFNVTAIDRNPRYVERAHTLGVRAAVVSGEKLPFPDDCFDTVFLVEVLEHIPDMAIPRVLSEVARVTRGNVLFTVPDCTQYKELVREGFLFGHFWAVDHVQFFTADNLPALLRQFFPRVDVTRGDPLFPHRFLPPVVRRPISLLYRLGWLRSQLYSRLYAEARKKA